MIVRSTLGLGFFLFILSIIFIDVIKIFEIIDFIDTIDIIDISYIEHYRKSLHETKFVKKNGSNSHINGIDKTFGHW